MWVFEKIVIFFNTLINYLPNYLWRLDVENIHQEPAQKIEYQLVESKSPQRIQILFECGIYLIEITTEEDK